MAARLLIIAVGLVITAVAVLWGLAPAQLPGLAGAPVSAFGEAVRPWGAAALGLSGLIVLASGLAPGAPTAPVALPPDPLAARDPRSPRGERDGDPVDALLAAGAVSEGQAARLRDLAQRTETPADTEAFWDALAVKAARDRPADRAVIALLADGATTDAAALMRVDAVRDDDAPARTAERAALLTPLDRSAALEAYRLAARQAPASFAAQLGLARLSRIAGYWDESRRAVDAALAAAADDDRRRGPALIERGIQRLGRGDRVGARECFREGLDRLRARARVRPSAASRRALAAGLDAVADASAGAEGAEAAETLYQESTALLRAESGATRPA